MHLLLKRMNSTLALCLRCTVEETAESYATDCTGAHCLPASYATGPDVCNNAVAQLQTALSYATGGNGYPTYNELRLLFKRMN
jgi:hypothetical protein